MKKMIERINKKLIKGKKYAMIASGVFCLDVIELDYLFKIGWELIGLNNNNLYYFKKTSPKRKRRSKC